MIIVGKTVPDGNAGIFGELFAGFLGKSAEENSVVDAAENAGGILNRLLLPEVDVGARQIFGAAAFITDGDDRRIACTGRGLLENKRDILAFEKIAPYAGSAAGLKLGGEVDEIEHLLVGERRQTHKRAVTQRIHPCQHFYLPSSVSLFNFASNAIVAVSVLKILPPRERH